MPNPVKANEKISVQKPATLKNGNIVGQVKKGTPMNGEPKMYGLSKDTFMGGRPGDGARIKGAPKTF